MGVGDLLIAALLTSGERSFPMAFALGVVAVACRFECDLPLSTGVSAIGILLPAGDTRVK